MVLVVELPDEDVLQLVVDLLFEINPNAGNLSRTTCGVKSACGLLVTISCIMSLTSS